MRKRPLLEKDVLLDLFTLDQGKMTVTAKGVKKITSRRAPHLQTGNLVHFELQERHERWYLQQSQLISGFTAVRDHERRTSVMYILLFVLDRILPDAAPEPDVYILARRFMAEISRSEENEPAILKKYLYDVMVSLGYVQGEKTMKELIMIIEEIIHEKIPFRII